MVKTVNNKIAIRHYVVVICALIYAFVFTNNTNEYSVKYYSAKQEGYLNEELNKIEGSSDIIEQTNLINEVRRM